jgi:predicted ATPase/class 3 adenylate cyclase
VTLLFTDIQGSTRLWEDHAEAMAPALQRHDTILREAIESHGGYVFKTVGDAFCAAFASASDAVESAGGAQLALQTEEWPDGATLRVRMALHTGECEERDGDYFGPPVNRTARLEATAHGGQVVLSHTTASLVRERLPRAWGLLDLGSHRLKDLGREEQVVQLTIPGLPGEFPPLRSLDNPALANNLPAQSASFIGRAREVAEVRDLVKANRLVTLAGAGGAGKTRLALQVAAELLDGSGDGVWLVELAPVLDPDALAAAVCQALGIADRPGQSDVETLVEVLTSQDVLVVLDNCEHLVEACARLADAILRRCPTVHLLATSREPLGVAGEVTYRVPSMSLPDTTDDPRAAATDSDAVSLFVGRVADHGVELPMDDAGLSLIVSICRRLDGMPLALELAAARLRSMSLADVHDRLDQRFRLLTGGSRSALPRQQTLRATVEWSYSLLGEREKTTLRRLSWFTDGFDLAAAEAVCGFGEIDPFDVADLVGSLVDKSLVVSESGRYRQLETIRQFSVERLVDGDEGEIADVAEAHAVYFLALAEKAASYCWGPDELGWLARLESDYANLRRAIEHVATTGPADRPVRFAAALGRYWWTSSRDWPTEMLLAVLPFVTDADSGVDPALRARALVSISNVPTLMSLGLVALDELADEAVRVARTLDDEALLTEALYTRGGALWAVNSCEQGRTVADEALARARSLDDDRLIAAALLVILLVRTSDMVDEAFSNFTDETQALYDEALMRAERCGNRIVGTVLGNNAACGALEFGDVATARRYIDRTMALGVWEHLAHLRNTRAMVLHAEGDIDAAYAELQVVLRMARRSGSRAFAAYGLAGVALVAQRRHDRHLAARLLGAADALMEQADSSWQRHNLRLNLACADALVADLGEAAFRVAYDEGRSLSMDDATALGLDA